MLSVYLVAIFERILRLTDLDMLLEGRSLKRKSGAAYLKQKKAKIDEGSFMLNFCKPLKLTRLKS